MSTLSAQSGKLRSWADQLSEREEELGVVVRALVADLREAADTIEDLRSSLNEIADKCAEAQIKAEDYARENMLLKRDDDTRWHELFGTPERAVRTLSAIGGRYPCDKGAQDCETCPLNRVPCRLNRDKPEESKLLEWLSGDAE